MNKKGQNERKGLKEAQILGFGHPKVRPPRAGPPLGRAEEREPYQV